MLQANVDAFQMLAEADGKVLTAEIAGGISLKGVQDNFFRLFSILLDNAVKYCDPAGTIRLCVLMRGLFHRCPPAAPYPPTG